MNGCPVIPDHTLLRPIGRGAYGEVWLAQNIMGTYRAVKVVWRRQFESERPFEREFAGIRRFEPVSRSSGGLVHVLHAGRNDEEGYFYYLMELADPADDLRRSVSQVSSATASPPVGPGDSGEFTAETYQPRTLRSELERNGRLSTADCIRVAMEVVSGLAQLHSYGLVHRDIKPGNIIFVHGRAKLADIGLVSAPGEGRTFVGTEGYIPPEGPGTPGADLYALGIVLFEAATGHPPERVPDAPSEWFSESAGNDALEFYEVILRACESRRERRYQSAEEMQADLALLQSGRSIRHLRALARRNAQLRVAGIAAALMLVCAMIVVVIANYRARIASESRAREIRLREQAQVALAQAQSAGNEARRQLNAALYGEARSLVLSRELGHRTRALEAIRQSNGATNMAELRRVAFAALQLPDLRLEREIVLPQEKTLAQLDPHFERIALGQGVDAVTIHSLPDLKTLHRLPPASAGSVFEARWSCDAKFLAVKRQRDSGGGRSDVEVWSLEPAAHPLRVETNVAFNSISFHPARSALMLGYLDGAVKSFELEPNTETATFHFPKTIRAVEYSPDGQRFALCHQAATNWQLAICDAATGEVLSRFECLKSAERIAWHPQARWLSTMGFEAVDWNRTVRLISPEDGSMTQLGRHKMKTAMLDFSPDGDYLMSCGWDNQIFCWDLRNQQRAFTLAGSGFLQFWCAEPEQYAAILPNWHLRLFHFDHPACHELTGNTGEILRPGAFSPDGRWFAVPEAKNVWVWELGRSSYPARLPVTGPAKSFSGSVEPFFSPDSSTLFVVGGPIENARLEAWQLEPCVNNTVPPRLKAVALRVPPRLSNAGVAGDKLILTSAEGVRCVSLTNIGAGDGEVTKIPSGNGVVSPDGRWLAMIYSYSPKVSVYRLPEVQRVAELETRNLVADVCFSCSGDELAVINRSGIEFWDTQTWRFRRHEPGVANSYILYPPTGKGVWKVTNFHDAALHNRKTLEKLLPLPPNMLPLALSYDGKQLAVSVDDQRVQVWDLATLRAQFREVGLDWD